MVTTPRAMLRPGEWRLTYAEPRYSGLSVHRFPAPDLFTASKQPDDRNRQPILLVGALEQLSLDLCDLRTHCPAERHSACVIHIKGYLFTDRRDHSVGGMQGIAPSHGEAQGKRACPADGDGVNHQP